MKKPGVKERNRRFFQRLDICVRQQKAAGGSHHIVGNPDLVFEVVNMANTPIPNWGAQDRDNSDVELRITTPGHEWHLLPDWTDSLYEWLGRVIAARSEPRKEKS